MNNMHIPSVVLTAFRVQGKKKQTPLLLTGLHPIVLSFKENSFSFEFAALDYTDPSKNSYRYRLDNFDKTWKPRTTRRFASYTNIPPGNYTFRVIGSNNDGTWNRVGTSVDIKIVPPFWQTDLFRVLFYTSVLFLIYCIFRLRVRSIDRRRKKLRELVAQRTRQLKEAHDEAERQQKTA
ncbi:MAG: histidine kinase, partial [bacterium]|nr:histidine kinase [bacterium]